MEFNNKSSQWETQNTSKERERNFCVARREVLGSNALKMIESQQIYNSEDTMIYDNIILSLCIIDAFIA
jgi:hypothetical protein